MRAHELSQTCAPQQMCDGVYSLADASHAWAALRLRPCFDPFL